MNAGSGDDVYGGNGNDELIANEVGLTGTLNGDAGNDILRSGNKAITMSGGIGLDQFYAGLDRDIMFGDDGNDIFIMQYATTTTVGDYVDGGTGIDSIIVLGDATSITLYGIANVETISAEGYTGVYIRGTTGAENLDFSVTTLIGIDHIEMLDGNDTVKGSAGDDVIFGNGGNDIINGGLGTDTAVYSGARGDYQVTVQADGSLLIVDNRVGSSDGSDTVSGVEEFDFADGVYVLADLSGNIAPTDMALSNTLVAENSAIGAVVGALSATDPNAGDTFTYTLLDDAAGRFAISGSNLVVAGGSGNDTFTVDNAGAAGDDSFEYLAVTDGNDTIADFSQSGANGADLIDVSGIDANGVTTGNQAFAFGGGVATANGVWFTESGGNTLLSFDTDGNTASVEMTLTLTGIGLGLSAADFVL